MTAPVRPLYEQAWPEGDYRFFQLGHVVDDVIAAARAWARSFGIGPFHVMPVVEQQLTYAADDVRTIQLQVAVAQAGPVQIELIQQQCDTPSIYREWSRHGTSAFHQVATVTDDYDGKLRDLTSRGHRITAQSLNGTMRVAYLDTVDEFGFYTEVVEASDRFLAQLDRISQACAAWDGTDPVRLLTRDGYRVPDGDG